MEAEKRVTLEDYKENLIELMAIAKVYLESCENAVSSLNYAIGELDKIILPTFQKLQTVV